MTKTKEKQVVLSVDNVRVIKTDELNYTVEQQVTKDGVSKWTFKGYAGSIKNALALIVKRELLVDKARITSVSDYLSAVEASNDKLFDFIAKLAVEP